MFPSLTIGIPSFQRRDELARLLRSVQLALSDGVPAEVEVVVVLDGSTDGSDAVCVSLASEFPCALRHLWQPNRGLAAARNTIVDNARHEIIWLLDDDMTVTRAALLGHLGHDRAASPIVMGPCAVTSSDPDVVQATWWYELRHSRLAATRSVADPQDASFANTSAPVELVRRFRFTEEFTGYGVEDFELALRLLHSGISIAFDPDAAVVHHAASPRTERRRKLRHEGINRVRFVELHPEHGDVVFRTSPGRTERLLRRFAVLPVGRMLGVLPPVIDAVATSVGRPFRKRLLDLADLTAIYSGVAAAHRDRARGAVR